MIFGATCGCDVPYVESVVEEMVALGATQEFFETYIQGYGFHGFRASIWRSDEDKYRGAPEVEVPSPHRYTPDDEKYGKCSMFTHYKSLGAPTRSFLEHVSELRTAICSVTGQEADAIELYCTEDSAPFHYDWPCRAQIRSFVLMSKYLCRSFLTSFFAGVHISHWQMQEGDSGDGGADYGLINRTHTNSGCRLAPDRPFMLPEREREAYWTFQAIASIFDKTLNYVNPQSIGVQLLGAPAGEFTLPIQYQPRPERSDIAAGIEEIALMAHVPSTGSPREGSVIITNWKMTDFPLTVGTEYKSQPGLTHARTNRDSNPNTIAAWLQIDLSSSELFFDVSTPPEVWQIETMPDGDFHSLDVYCPETPMTFAVDRENPTTITVNSIMVSDYASVIEITTAEYPSFKGAGTLDSYLALDEHGALSGNLGIAALPYGFTFIDEIKVFYRDFDLQVSLNDGGEGPDGAAGDGLFRGVLTAPGTAPGAANSLIAEGARHPLIFAAGISQNAMFAHEGGSFTVRAFAFDADNPGDPAAIASCVARIPNTDLVFPMEQTIAAQGSIESHEWTARLEFDDVDWLEAGTYPVEVVATDTDGLLSVPWPHIPTGDGTYLEELYLNLHVKGKGGVFRNCWPELRVKP